MLSASASAQAVGQEKQCAKCKKLFPLKSKFCDECGKPLVKAKPGPIEIKPKEGEDKGPSDLFAQPKTAEEFEKIKGIQTIVPAKVQSIKTRVRIQPGQVFRVIIDPTSSWDMNGRPRKGIETVHIKTDYIGDWKRAVDLPHFSFQGKGTIEFSLRSENANVSHGTVRVKLLPIPGAKPELLQPPKPANPYADDPYVQPYTLDEYGAIRGIEIQVPANRVSVKSKIAILPGQKISDHTQSR